jgi:hypothetical protein
VNAESQIRVILRILNTSFPYFKRQEAIMTQNSRHVAPTLDNRWSVRRSGASRASKIFDKKAEAVAYASILALREHTDLYIHGTDGMVVEKPDLKETSHQNSHRAIERHRRQHVNLRRRSLVDNKTKRVLVNAELTDIKQSSNAKRQKTAD